MFKCFDVTLHDFLLLSISLADQTASYSFHSVYKMHVVLYRGESWELWKRKVWWTLLVILFPSKPLINCYGVLNWKIFISISLLKMLFFGTENSPLCFEQLCFQARNRKKVFKGKVNVLRNIHYFLLKKKPKVSTKSFVAR